MLRESNILRLVVALILVSVAVACSATAEDGTAELLVTGDFGHETFAQETVPAGPSVLASLQAVTEVETAYGGGFVEGMFGRSSSQSPRADWFYFVDGRLAESGARGRTVRAGEHVWWDHRPWGGPFEIRAVVGSWPAPFLGEGRAVRADAPLAAALRRLGGEITEEASAWKVVVGSDADLRSRSAAWGAAAEDASGQGIAATVEGDRVRALDSDGTMIDVPGGAAVAVALAGGIRESDGFTLAIVGVDQGAARAAAETVATDPATLSGQYAVVFDDAGRIMKGAGRP